MGLLARAALDAGGDDASADVSIWLFREHTFGRGTACSTVLDRGAVSRVHARISWNGARWTLRDMASRNGTYLNGRRLAEGRSVDLDVGDRVHFGDLRVEYRLVDASPPESMVLVQEPDGGSRKVALSSCVTLPSPEQPLCTILCGRGDEYVLEREGGGTEPLDHGSVFQLGDLRCTVVLATDSSQSPQTASSDFDVGREEVEIAVSPDEESAEIVVRRWGEHQVFAPRAHFYLLAHLARVRQEQSVAGNDASDDAGWVDCESVCRDLRINREHLAQQVFRIRQDLKAASPELAERIVDRRLRGRMRFGLPPRQFLIRPLG